MKELWTEAYIARAKADAVKHPELTVLQLPISNRAINVCMTAGITTKEQAVEAIKNRSFLRLRSVGQRTYDELAEALNLTDRFDQTSNAPRCPTCGRKL